uniref:NTR domain-containing protein n=1 Tax=Compsopogon caeruleus TaxID=31354 RepID=A0A7S1T650_9RHOD
MCVKVSFFILVLGTVVHAQCSCYEQGALRDDVASVADVMKVRFVAELARDTPTQSPPEVITISSPPSYFYAVKIMKSFKRCSSGIATGRRTFAVIESPNCRGAMEDFNKSFLIFGSLQNKVSPVGYGLDVYDVVNPPVGDCSLTREWDSLQDVDKKYLRGLEADLSCPA